MLKQPKEILLNFVENACDYTGFESIILPSLLNLCSEPDNEMISTLGKIIVNKTSHRKEFTKYPLKFRPETIQTVLLNRLTEWDEENLQELSGCVLLLPHITPLSADQATAALSMAITKIVKIVTEPSRRDSALCCLFIALEALNHFQHKSTDVEMIYHQVLPLASESFVAFKILEILTMGNLGTFDTTQLREIAIGRLTSPYHKIRTSALKTLQNIRCETVLDTCLKAEMTPLSVQTYRNATLQIRELHYEKMTQGAEIEVSLI